jgi:hypothetical protein
MINTYHTLRVHHPSPHRVMTMLPSYVAFLFLASTIGTPDLRVVHESPQVATTSTTFFQGIPQLDGVLASNTGTVTVVGGLPRLAE